MNVLIVGKYPPIQGGVSTQTYWMACDLARRGHEVVVATDADEVEPAFRMYMREADWGRSEGVLGGGVIRVIRTKPHGGHVRHIPDHNPVVSKLVSLGIDASLGSRFDAVLSFYLEPYAIAGHMIAQCLGVPHIVRTAGSDIGRLWQDRQLSPAYEMVLRGAAAVMTAGAMIATLGERGIDADRLFPTPPFRLPLDLFAPEGEVLDIGALATELHGVPGFEEHVFGSLDPVQPLVGVYGKIGPHKGLSALLQSLARVAKSGRRLGLVILGQGVPERQAALRREITALNLDDRVLQLPFLPHWRVPEFIRRCRTVFCLEQDFPISFHRPAGAREVMTCGGVLVATLELLRKMPNAGRLIDGYNCVAVADGNDVRQLTGILAAIADRPDAIADVGRRARRYGCEVDMDLSAHRSAADVLETVVSDGAAVTKAEPTESAQSTAPDANVKRVEDFLNRAARLPVSAGDRFLRIAISDWAARDRDLLALRPVAIPIDASLDFVAEADGLATVLHNAWAMQSPPSGPGRLVISGGRMSVLDRDLALALDACNGTHTLRALCDGLARAPVTGHTRDADAWLQVFLGLVEADLIELADPIDVAQTIVAAD